jgi:uncharacterized protein YneF (UPF0154 family)
MEQITITIPEGWNEIKIGQYQEYIEVLNNCTETRPYKKIISLLSVLTDTDEFDFYKMPMDTIYDINNSITFMNEEPKGVFNNIIVVNGIEYGFQKDMNQLTLGEWIDLEHYVVDGVMKNLHYITAILYRPILDKGDDYFDYTIAPYDSINLERNAKLFKYSVSIDDIYGISGFFLTIANELLTPMIYYLDNPTITEMEMRVMMTKMMKRVKDVEQKKKLMEVLENNDLSNGIGNYLSTIFAEGTFGDTKKS